MDENIRNLVGRYLRKEIRLQDFQQHFAGLYFQVRKNRRSNWAASKLCDAIVLPLAELSRGHRSEISFREELANAVRPFADFAAEPLSVSWNESDSRPRTIVHGTGSNLLKLGAPSDRASAYSTCSLSGVFSNIENGVMATTSPSSVTRQ